MKLEWKYDEEMNEYDYIHNTPEPPRRVPYTAETWPAWAVWVRRKTWSKGVRSPLHVRLGAIVILDKNDEGAHETIPFHQLAEHCEISGTDGVWHAASREVTE